MARRRSSRSRSVLAATTITATVLVLALGPATPAAAAPVISGFDPASGPVGTRVTIQGSGFSPSPVTVSFNGTQALHPRTNNAGTRICTELFHHTHDIVGNPGGLPLAGGILYAVGGDRLHEIGP